MKFLSLLASFSLLTSCSYHWTRDYPNGERPSVNVPFVDGDKEGFLTTEMIQALTVSGLVDVVPSGGTYELKLSVVGSKSENIGFRIVAQNVDKKARNNLRPSEGRMSLTVEASLFCNSELIYGPYVVVADADYDYVDGDSAMDLTFANSDGGTVTVLPFSLGQLEPIDSAETAVLVPLYRKIAQKIVDAISSEW